MVGQSIGIFKLRCAGEKWNDVLSHPGIYKTSLQAQIVLDAALDGGADIESIVLNLFPVGLGLISKQSMSRYITNDKNRYQMFFVNQWDEYWDVL